MKRVVSWCVLALFLLATAPWSQAQKDAGTEKAVADLEQQWLKSQRTNDVKLLEPLLATGFTNTSSDGKVSNRAETIAEAKATKYTSVDYIDVKVTVFGDVAIAIGNFRGKGTDASGKPIDANERFTDTWAKMANGKWQCIASHQSPVKM
ncbi:MAG: nuclear transport factor 2 family protein [Terriglobales bacterium]